MRLWYEVSIDHIGFSYSSLAETKDCRYKFIPEPKGGEYRKWYGNYEYVVNWKNNGEEIRKAAEGASGGRIVGSEFYLREGLTWTDITSYKLAVRYLPKGMIFNSSAPSCFCDDNTYLYYLLGYMNSIVSENFLRYLAPTIHFNAGPIERLPLIVDKEKLSDITKVVRENVAISKTDWDSFETSWDFQKHPLIPSSSNDKPNISYISVS